MSATKPEGLLKATFDAKAALERSVEANRDAKATLDRINAARELDALPAAHAADERLLKDKSELLIHILQEGGGFENIHFLNTIRELEFAFLCCAANRRAARAIPQTKKATKKKTK